MSVTEYFSEQLYISYTQKYLLNMTLASSEHLLISEIVVQQYDSSTSVHPQCTCHNVPLCKRVHLQYTCRNVLGFFFVWVCVRENGKTKSTDHKDSFMKQTLLFWRVMCLSLCGNLVVLSKTKASSVKHFENYSYCSHTGTQMRIDLSI